MSLSAGRDPTSDLEAHEALKTILSDQETFKQVVDTVFETMDRNADGLLDVRELEQFIIAACGTMGITDPPSRDQVNHVFRHLDLNNDHAISKDELAVFLQHLFNEQLKHTEEKLRKLGTLPAAGAAGSGGPK